METEMSIFAPSTPIQRNGLSLTGRIVLLAVSGILLLGVCVTVVSKYVLERGAGAAALERVEANMRVAWNVVRSKGEKFRIADGKLLLGDRVLNGDVQLVDEIRGLVGGTSTIFMNDQRIATTIIKSDGARATGTRLARSEAYAAIFDKGTSYRGEVQILDEPYMTAYDPIRGPNGESLGILYVGIKRS